MRYEFFIAKRFIKTKQSKFSTPIISVAIASIALGIAVMLLSVFVLTGFKQGIREKIAGFGSHIQVLPYNVSNEYLTEPMTLSPEERQRLAQIGNIKRITPFINKGGAIKTPSDFLGVVLKGINSEYDTAFFHSNLKQGRVINTSNPNEVLISAEICSKLDLHLGDKIRVFFYIDQTYRQRAFTIVGIYETGLGLYDDKTLICSVEPLQKLNLWLDKQYEGYEIMLKDYGKLQQTADSVYAALDNDKTIQTIEELEPTLFAWLSLLDSNVAVILCVMLLVSIVVITSSLLIMVFERRQTIGILKGFGASSRSIAVIFASNAVYIILKGLIYGNILAFLIALLQKKTAIFALNPQNYYLDSVPISINWLYVLLVNLLAVVICSLSLLLPARSISKISPVQNIKHE